MKILLLTFSLLSKMHVGRATVFWATDDLYNPNSKLACNGKELRDTDMYVAHPKFPCGSKVFLYNLRTHMATVAVVMDRGPRHAMVDTSRAVARAIGLNGSETVAMLSFKEGGLE